MAFSKTRFSPTPSGYLHLGNAMSFMITAALAKEKGAKILLRVDDLDQVRVKKNYVEDIFNTLNFLDIPWDEGPRDFKTYKTKYAQIHRMEFYKKALDHLKNTGSIFACICSRRTVSRESSDGSYPGTCHKIEHPFEDKEASWRLYTNNKEIKINELSGKVYSSTLPHLLKDFVIRRKDGMPSYQLTSVVDDLLDRVDFIVRGKDLMGSSLAQTYLAEKLPGPSLNNVSFFHHQLMTDDKNRKMAKTAGSTSIQHLIKTGKTSADIYQTIGEFLKLKRPVTSFEEFQQVFIQQNFSRKR